MGDRNKALMEVSKTHIENKLPIFVSNRCLQINNGQTVKWVVHCILLFPSILMIGTTIVGPFLGVLMSR